MSGLGEVRALADGELARRVIGGAIAHREEAELCRRFAPRVRLYGLRHLGSDDDAADLVQRVLTLTIEKLRGGAIDDPDRIASFVLGAARITSAEMRRRGRREAATPAEDLDTAHVTLDEDITVSRDRLAQCLQALAERERSVLLLAFFQGRSAQEIGEALSLSEGNVRVVRHRAIARVRDCMGLGRELDA